MTLPQAASAVCNSQRFLNSMDRQGAKFHLCVTVVPMIFIALRWPWQDCKTSLFWLAIHASISLLAYIWCIHPDRFYWKHRSMIIMAFQSLELCTVLQFTPPAFEMALGTQIAQGKAFHFTCAVLICGLGSYSIGTHCLIALLSWTAAACFTAVRLVVAIYYLAPLQVSYLSLPAVREIALDIKSSVDLVYNSVMSLTTLTAIEPATVPRCQLLSLALWVHVCIGGWFPLYFLYVMEGRFEQEHGVSIGAAEQLVAQQLSSRSSSTVPAPRRRTLTQTSSRSSRSDLTSTSLDDGLSSEGSSSSMMYHCVLLFGFSMLIWAVVDCLVVLFEDFALRHGVCV